MFSIAGGPKVPFQTVCDLLEGGTGTQRITVLSQDGAVLATLEGVQTGPGAGLALAKRLDIMAYLACRTPKGLGHWHRRDWLDLLDNMLAVLEADPERFGYFEAVNPYSFYYANNVYCVEQSNCAGAWWEDLGPSIKALHARAVVQVENGWPYTIALSVRERLEAAKPEDKGYVDFILANELK